MPAISRWWKRQHTRLKLHISVEHTLSHKFVDFIVSASYLGMDLGQGGYFKIALKNSRDKRMCPHLAWPFLCSSLGRQQKPRAVVAEASHAKLHHEWVFLPEWFWEGFGETEILCTGFQVHHGWCASYQHFQGTGPYEENCKWKSSQTHSEWADFAILSIWINPLSIWGQCLCRWLGGYLKVTLENFRFPKICLHLTCPFHPTATDGKNKMEASHASPPSEQLFQFWSVSFCTCFWRGIEMLIRFGEWGDISTLFWRIPGMRCPQLTWSTAQVSCKTAETAGHSWLRLGLSNCTISYFFFGFWPICGLFFISFWSIFVSECDWEGVGETDILCARF